MPSPGTHMLTCLLVLDVCVAGAGCRAFAMHCRGGRAFAMRCRGGRAFAMSHCMLRGFRVDFVFICFATTRGPLRTDRVGNGWKEQYQRPADCCHDMFIHKIISSFCYRRERLLSGRPDSPCQDLISADIDSWENRTETVDFRQAQIRTLTAPRLPLLGQ